MVEELIQPKIFIYRLFHVGEHIDEAIAKKCLDTSTKMALRKEHRSIVITEVPLVVLLPTQWITFENNRLELKCSAKLWSFGAISIRFELDLKGAHTSRELSQYGYFFENTDSITNLAREILHKLIETIKEGISSPVVWKEYEDFVMYCIPSKLNPDFLDLKDFWESDIAPLLLVEDYEAQYSNEVINSLKKSAYRYSDNDLVLIHWNSALVYDEVDHEDIADIIEFSLSQMLELRFYDELLESELANLYETIELFKIKTWSNPYSKISIRAARQYMQVSKIVDRISNAFKTTGDYYYATIYKMATQKFYLNDWRRTVSEKLGNLVQVSKLFQGEINEHRNQIMEGIIILLIAIEVIPFILSWILGK